MPNQPDSFVDLLYSRSFAGVLLISMIEPNSQLIKARPQTKSSEFGASFSIRYAQDFGLDWQAVLMSALKDLKIRRFRLMSHWPLIEPSQGDYTWVDLDWQMDQVAKHHGIVNLAIGLR